MSKQLEPWANKRIDEVCDLGRGRVISQEDIRSNFGLFPVYSSQSRDDGVFGYLNTYDFEGDYVTWTTDGANAGTVFFRNGRFNCTNVCGTLKIKSNEINARYLARALSTVAKRYVNYVGNPKLMNNVMGSIRLDFPTKPEQDFIASLLDTVDEAIAKTEAVIAKLKQVRAGMLHDLLSYGLDENGQLRDPIAHPEQFKYSPLGRIPKEWDVSRIEDVSEKVQDGTHFSPKSNKGPRRYLTSKNIRLGYIDLSDCGWISENEHRAIFRRCDVRRGDVLLTKDGANTGNAAINILDDDFSLLSSVAFIRGKKDRLISEYLLNYLISPVAQKRIKDLMSGNAITRLTLQKINDFKIPVPEPIEQQMIAEYFNECAITIIAYEAELESYRNIKSGLQDDLLTGRVRVPETIMEGAAEA